MSRSKSRFVIKSGKENAVAKIMWSNYNAACGKTVIKRLTVKDAAGKVVLEQKNIKPQTMVQYFSFKLGTPGSSYFVDIDCDSKSLWVIPGSKDYTAYHDSSIQIPFVSLVSGRFELEQLAGETINLKFTPLHMGNFGIKVLTADGTLLFEQKGFKSETKLSGNQKRVNITVPAAKQKRTLVLELFAGNCATLDCQPAKLISRPGK